VWVSPVLMIILPALISSENFQIQAYACSCIHSSSLIISLHLKNLLDRIIFLMQTPCLSLQELHSFVNKTILKPLNGWKDANAGSEINKNPFIELLYDREEWLPGDSVVTTKIAFAKEMLRLQKLIEKGNVEAMYRYALGLYNTTYYGYAWELVEYFRSGNDGYDLPKNATDFYKEYYGAHAAHDYFQKAYQASKDKEFKAKCLFMMAKCSQKDLQRPNYADYRDYEAYRIAENDYYFDFYNNIYFPQFVKEYGKTKFYQQAFNSCSYLRDFVKKQSK
jgi:hypothetical protein